MVEAPTQKHPSRKSPSHSRHKPKNLAKMPLVKKVERDLYFRCDVIDDPTLKHTLVSSMAQALISKDRPEAQAALHAKFLHSLITQAVQKVRNEKNVTPNMCRIRTTGEDASVMIYDSLCKPHPELKKTFPFKFEFDEYTHTPVPQLRRMVTISPREEKTNNPPILHRVETLFMPGTEEHQYHAQITEEEERIGVFDQGRTKLIGRKQGMMSVLDELNVSRDFIIEYPPLKACVKREMSSG